jgi:hypothetical protein
VADRPLRPATDRSLGGPLPHQPANRTRAPPTPPRSEDRDFGPSCEGHHPVLAAVSRGCPEARGRFPRVTHPCATRCRAEALHPVRLACVRRAASVRSEPGSNSQLEPPAPPDPATAVPRPQPAPIAPGTRRSCDRPWPTASLIKAGPPPTPRGPDLAVEPTCPKGRAPQRRPARRPQGPPALRTVPPRTPQSPAARDRRPATIKDA